MLDNYNELREGMLAQCDKPAFPDQCLYTEAPDDPRRHAAVIKKIKKSIKTGDIKSKRFHDYIGTYRAYTNTQGRTSDAEIDKFITDKNKSADRKIKGVKVAGTAVGATMGGVVAHKLSKKFTRNMKSARAAKAVNATATLAGTALGGYGGYRVGKKMSRSITKY